MTTPPDDTTLTPILASAFSALWRQRYHGAANVGGVRYQLMYFSHRVFDLYNADAPDEIVGEGIEDVDLASVTLGNEYVQIKHARRGLAWGTFVDALLGFVPALRDDPTARLTLVTDVRLQGAVRDVIAASDAGRALPKAPARKLARAFADAPVTAETVLERLCVEIQSEAALIADLTAAVTEHFAVATGNEELYALAIFAELAERASRRIAVRRADLEVFRARIETAISRGPVNPSVRDGFVGPLSFVASDRSDDYYEGRAARPDHIAAGLDVLRGAVAAQIDESLARVPVCVVLASSGQGKSTAAYRYAHDHYRPESRFAVGTCQDEADVGQIAQYLRSRLGLGLPLLVVIDGLSRRTRLWHRLADAFSRRCIGWTLDRHLDASLTIAALHHALTERSVAPGLVHHSDRGVQYASHTYTGLLAERGIQISMSRRGNPYDNAKAESFIKTLKYEEVYLNDYETLAAASAAIDHFLGEVYNRKRLHSALGYVPPIEFERELLSAMPHHLGREIIHGDAMVAGTVCVFPKEG